MEIRNPTNGIKSLCEELGDKYSVRVFDLENVIYRDLGNGYDFELSGVDNNKKHLCATLYIWNNIQNVIVEKVERISSVEDLKSILNNMVDKYETMDSSAPVVR